MLLLQCLSVTVVLISAVAVSNPGRNIEFKLIPPQTEYHLPGLPLPASYSCAYIDPVSSVQLNYKCKSQDLIISQPIMSSD